MQSNTLSNIYTEPALAAPVKVKPGQASSAPHLIKPLVRWAFYAFVFSLLFEELPIGVPLEVTLITGAFLVLVALVFQPRRCFLYPPAAFWCFIVYFWLGIVILAFYHSLFGLEVIMRQVKLLQLIFMFWVAYNLMRDEATARGALLTLVAACALVSLLHMFGLTITTEGAVSKLDRFVAFGLDSNQLGGVMALAVLAMVGLAYGLSKDLFRPRILVWPVVALIGITIVQTGSRGGLLALVSGLLVFTLRKGNVLSKVRNVLIVLMGMGFFFWIGYQSQMVQHRFQVTLEDGNLSEREQIYPAAWEMFREKPVIGWGPFINTIELGNRLRLPNMDRIDAHNLILYVLTATGVVGTIPFLAGLGLCVRAAWKARGGAHGILPLAMTACLLITDMSVSGFHYKQHWLILAYALASGTNFVLKPHAPRRKSILAQPPLRVGSDS
jgi:O-antigen ligase